jgi:myosin-crossreactive antigen
VKAHIVGGGFGGLAAAALLLRNAGVSGADITIYEADELLGGGFFLGGSAERGYNLPGSVFDKEFRCTFDLLKSIPSAHDPAISVTEDFFAFNTGEPYRDKAHILDRDDRIVHGPRFGLGLGDGLCLARVVLTPEAMLDGRRIKEFFSDEFFLSEFWFLWSTIMGSLPQHSAIEFRRYMNRFLYLFGHLSDMTGVMRRPRTSTNFSSSRWSRGTSVWWGYGLYPDRTGNFVKKRMDQCTGAEILEETLRHLRFDQQLDAIMASSICVPCYLPYVNNIWLPRSRTDRPPPVPARRPTSDSSVNTSRFRGKLPSPSNAPSERRGRQSTPSRSAAPRRHLSTRANTI